MRILLDTHAFLWWIVDSARLSAPGYDLITEEANSLFVSVATAGTSSPCEIRSSSKDGGVLALN